MLACRKVAVDACFLSYRICCGATRSRRCGCAAVLGEDRQHLLFCQQYPTGAPVSGKAAVQNNFAISYYSEGSIAVENANDAEEVACNLQQA